MPPLFSGIVYGRFADIMKRASIKRTRRRMDSPMNVNPLIARKILKKIYDSPNGIAEFSADDFEMDYKVFGAQLEAMSQEGLISPYTAATIHSFRDEVKSADMKVKMMVGVWGETFLLAAGQIGP